MFYMNSEQGKRHGDSVLNESHFCPYSYFPRVEGLLDDGINAFSMEYQPVEFMKSLKPDTYGSVLKRMVYKNYVELGWEQMKRPAHGIRCIRIHSLCHQNPKAA